MAFRVAGRQRQPKNSLYKNSDIPYVLPIPPAEKGRFAIVTRRGPGGGGRDGVGALGRLQGGKPREQRHARYDTALTASSFGPDGERTPAIGDRGGDVRGGKIVWS